ncbi:nucleotidyltransferase family protein [Azospirillum sp. TSO22-1]|uniref:nucleotidyltransferase family protein n=1 Tax=Azospirillum sp. TSO22-1 TaxID=716789 RepID=UPI000D604094|nr:nucleotidyltransferase family protein [Azospirillum sp. TSO22-1]PWC55491.1 hypothetical protein TSO221_04185 [Azospirillum sp. TSO22-1]
MRSNADIVAFIEGRPFMMEALRAVESLGLPDAWIGAGFMRNAIWRYLHGQVVEPGSEDVDVVYFDPADARVERDLGLEMVLGRALPMNWSVCNQARMHGRNGDAPYRDTADALRHWPETATAVAVRWSGGRVELLAPFGLEDLLALRIRPTPAFQHKVAVYRARIIEKRWRERWPQAEIIEPASG